MTDLLQIFIRSVRCPSCGTIENKGTFKCPECGLFHASIPTEERKAPGPDERVQERQIDPSAYSLSSSSTPLDEEFQQTDEIQTWAGGNTDFSMIDEEDKPLAKILDKTSISSVDLIHED